MMNLENIRSKTGQTILQYAIPSIIAMVLTSLITIVDGFFIGNYIGESGIAAVNLGLPILYVYLGIGIMIGVGGIAIAGISLGAGNRKQCIGVFNQTVLTVICVSAIISLVVLILLKPIEGLIGMDLNVALHFNQYYSIMIFAYSVMILNATMGMFIRGEGNPQFFMLISMLTVGINVLLDYLFIQKFRLGIEGIAYASLVSVLVGMGLMIAFFLLKSHVYKFQGFQFSKDVLRETLLNGSSEFIGQMSMSLSLFAFNWVILRTVGVAGVAAFTIVGYVAYLFSMVIVGFGQGASPLIGFSYGAKDIQLSRGIRKKTNRFVVLSGIGFVVVMLLTSSWYSSVFVDSETVQTMIRSGVPIFVISFLFSGVNTITSFYFTSIGKAKESALISASRGLVVLLICIFTLPLLLGMTGVWLVAPVTEVITILLSIALIRQNDNAVQAVV